MASPFNNNHPACQHPTACQRSSLNSSVCQPCHFRRRRIEANKTKWRHLKRGTTYTEIGRGTLQASGSALDGVPIVIYQGDDDASLWCRPVAEFEDGRFERIGEGEPK